VVGGRSEHRGGAGASCPYCISQWGTVTRVDEIEIR
jgi:hypothetical protein